MRRRNERKRKEGSKSQFLLPRGAGISPTVYTSRVRTVKASASWQFANLQVLFSSLGQRADRRLRRIRISPVILEFRLLLRPQKRSMKIARVLSALVDGIDDHPDKHNSNEG
jgi:hypothetical protein